MLLQETVTDVPVVLVGNKTDQWGDRMVSLEEGQRRSKEIGCVCFHEISVRESIEQVGRYAFYYQTSNSLAFRELLYINNYPPLPRSDS
jgi:GTPase SAR1 family protein